MSRLRKIVRQYSFRYYNLIVEDTYKGKIEGFDRLNNKLTRSP